MDNKQTNKMQGGFAPSVMMIWIPAIFTSKFCIPPPITSKGSFKALPKPSLCTSKGCTTSSVRSFTKPPLLILRNSLRGVTLEGWYVTNSHFWKGANIDSKTHMWMFPKIAGKSPKWMVKIMENYFLMDDLGGKPTIFGNIHMCKPTIIPLANILVPSTSTSQISS